MKSKIMKGRPVMVNYIYTSMYVICLCTLYTLVRSAPGEKKTHSICNNNNSYNALALACALSPLSRALLVWNSLSLLRAATALVPAALLFSRRHWGFGIESLRDAHSRCALVSCTRSCSCFALFEIVSWY